MREQLYPIPDHPGYFVSFNGDVYSTHRLADSEPPRQLRPWKGSNGYLCLKLLDSKKQRRFWRLSRLVAYVFHGPPPSPFHHARHLDGNLLNNRADNIAWGTRVENEADKTRHGRRPNIEGERNPHAKLCEEDVKEIHRLHSLGVSNVAIGRMFGVHNATISDICNRVSWRYVTETEAPR